MARGVAWALAAAAVLGLAGATAARDEVHLMEGVSHRLPLEAAPVHYDLAVVSFLEPGPKQFTFEGHITITVVAQVASTTLTLHCMDLDIDHVTVSGMRKVDWHYLPEFSFVLLEFDSPFEPGRLYNVSMHFSGLLHSDLHGFYLSSYIDSKGTKRFLALTQFQPTFARRAFPCFDEPAARARYTIKLARPEKLATASNMPRLRTWGPDPDTYDLFWDEYATTPEMATYLVAYLVSDFAALESGNYRVLAPPNMVEDARYALFIGQRVMRAFERLTGIPYLLPKMDQVAVPDFEMGAMENWGLVTYRAEILLTDERSIVGRLKAAHIIAHEFSHQWFGNLVTPRLWRYVWLSESITTFMEHIVSQIVEPEVSYEYYLQKLAHAVMRDDATCKALPMMRDMDTSLDIYETFGQYIYQKGPTVVRMTMHFLTEDVFFAGLRNYLSFKELGAAVHSELIDAWQEAASSHGAVLPPDVTVKDVMESWTSNAGYPVLTVVRDYDQGVAYVIQDRFLDHNNNFLDDCGNERWFVPIFFTTGSDRNFNDTRAGLWLKPQDNASLIRGLSSNDWLLLNHLGAGYYRVMYDADNYDRLITALDQEGHSDIPATTRGQWVDDAVHLGKANALPPHVWVSALRFLRRDVDPHAWRPAFTLVKDLLDKMALTPYFYVLQQFFNPLMRRILTTVGLEAREGEPSFYAIARPDMLDAACRLLDPECVIMADRLSPDELRKAHPAVWWSSMRKSRGLYERWNVLWSIYLSSKKPGQRKAVLAAMGCAEDEELIGRLLRMALDKTSPLRAEDRQQAVLAPCGSCPGPHSCDIAMEFIMRTIGRLQTLFGSTEDAQVLLLKLASRVRTPGQLKMLQVAIARRGRAPILLDAALQSAERTVYWSESSEGQAVLQSMLKESQVI